jgi:hypothetical protein
MIAWQLANDSNRIQTPMGTQLDELCKKIREMKSFLLSVNNDVERLESLKIDQLPPNERKEIQLQLDKLGQQNREAGIMISNSMQKLLEIRQPDCQNFLIKLKQWRSLFKNQAPKGATPGLEAVDALLAKTNEIKDNPKMLSPCTTLTSFKLLRKIFFDNGLDKNALIKVGAVSQVFNCLSSQTQETLPY